MACGVASCACTSVMLSRLRRSSSAARLLGSPMAMVNTLSLNVKGTTLYTLAIVSGTSCSASGWGLTSCRLTTLRLCCSPSACRSWSSVMRPRVMATWPTGWAVFLPSSRTSHSWSSSMSPRSTSTWPKRRLPPVAPLLSRFLGATAGLGAAGLPLPALAAGFSAVVAVLDAAAWGLAAGFAPGAGLPGWTAWGLGFLGGTGSFGVAIQQIPHSPRLAGGNNPRQAGGYVLLPTPATGAVVVIVLLVFVLVVLVIVV